jgi:hypothetical protein
MDSIQPPEPLTHAAILGKMLRDTYLWHGQRFLCYALPNGRLLF